MEKRYDKLYTLNIVKIRMELARINRSMAWLGRQLGESRQSFHYQMRRGSLKHAERIAEILKVPLTEILIPKIYGE